MSSRQEQKARLKEARLRAEREAAAREKRRRIIQIAAPALVAVLVIAGAVMASVMGGDAADNAASGPILVPLPPKQTDDLNAAAEAAGCKLGRFPDEGRTHVADSTALTYKTNPPTSGDHFQIPAQDGLYLPGNPPETGNWVHSLEHGRVLFQYRKGTPKRRVGQLETLFNQSFGGAAGGYHTLLLENTSKMPFTVAGVAWRRYVACERFTDRTFDALRAFREDAVDKAPEQVP